MPYPGFDIHDVINDVGITDFIDITKYDPFEYTNIEMITQEGCETQGAVLFNGAWIPKSLIRIDNEYGVWIPKWFSRKLNGDI